MPQGSLLLVISDWESQVLAPVTIEYMNDRFELIPIVLLHRGEEGEESFLSDMSIVDPETGETAVCGKIENDRHYRKVFDEAGVDPIELYIEDGEETWKVLIQEYFENRKKIRKIRRRGR